MQKYRLKTPVAAISDRLLRAVTAASLGVGWFVYLWGVSLPALTAGLAFGILLWLCVRQFSKQATAKREKQMRYMIGGELAIERLLLEPPRKAAFLCALWLNPKYPLVMHKAVDWSVIGTLEGRRTCIRLIAQHPQQKLTPQQVLECVREARERQMEQLLLCLTCPVQPEALAYAATLDPPVHIVERSELTELAGYAHPAADEDLLMISRRKKTRRSAREWLAVVLDTSRARRYFWYGTGLCLFALLTRSGYYVFPAAVCLGLFIACKLRDAVLSRHRHWKA